MIMVMVDTKLYRKYVTYDINGNAMFYVEMNKALYGLLQSALVFYKKLRKDFEAYNFVINTYYLCVANAMIESNQITVTWHVDDIKVSHKDPYQITKFYICLSNINGGKLKVQRGKVHVYLGME